jgi:DNA-binding ferritin-like protein
MMTKRYKSRSGGTRKRISSNSSLSNFQKEITIIFMEMLMMIKLYHWKTHSYATHKATDELYSKFNEHIDEFIEVLLGKTGSRIDLMSHKSIRLIDLKSQETLKKEIESFKGYLVNLDDNKALKTMKNSDLYNIRDEILGDLNQFLYLLTFTP